MDYPPTMQIDASGLSTELAARSEEIAMKCLRLGLRGEARRVDTPGGQPGMHDFDVLQLNGLVVAVEVTTCIDRTAAQFEAALEDHAIHMEPPGLRQSWEVRLHERVSVKGLINIVLPLLADLEAQHITGLARPDSREDDPMIRYDDRNHDDEMPRRAVNDLVELGVDTAWAFHREDGKQSVEFLRRSGSASGSSEPLVTAEVERAASNKQAVLSRPSALARDERHLFVWLEADFCGRIHFALWSGHPLSAPAPAIPTAINRVWVAGWSSTPGQGIGHLVVWEAIQGGHWQYPAGLLQSEGPN